MIVKVQISEFSSDGVQKFLAYDRGRKNVFQGETTPDLLQKMEGQNKAFFRAKIIKGSLFIGTKVENQSW